MTKELRVLAGQTAILTFFEGAIFTLVLALVVGLPRTWMEWAAGGVLFVMLSLLMAGAIALGRWTRIGYWLIVIGAIFVTISVLPLGISLLVAVLLNFSSAPKDLEFVLFTATVIVFIIRLDAALLTARTSRPR